MRITVKQLERLGACDEQVCLFATYFGKSAEVTRENCLAAADMGLSFEWAAQNLLSLDARHLFYAGTVGPLREYHAAVAPIHQLFSVATRRERAEFDAAGARAHAALEARKGLGFAAYEREVKAAMATRDAAVREIEELCIAAREPFYAVYSATAAEVFCRASRVGRRRGAR